MADPIRIPGYRVEKAIASGASGTVYLARQEDLDRPVALKVLQPGLFDEQETRQRFLREARLQARLSHPNVLALYDAGFEGDRPYIVTELVEGGSLRDLLSKGGLPAREVLRIGREIAAALAAAHEARIVHRDLKPENVLVAPDGSCKVADFGLAKSQTAQTTVQTKEGIILGTPGYLSPEALEGREAGASADIYALGVMLYELSAGRKPFEGSNLAGTLQAQIDGIHEPLDTVRHGIPAQLAELVHACISRHPDQRPASMSEVRDRLLSIRATGPSARKIDEARVSSQKAATSQMRVPAMTQEATRVTRVEPAPRRAIGLPLAAAGVVLLLIAFAALGPREAAPPAPPPVRIVRVTSGCDAIRVELAAPPATPTTITVELVGEGTGRSEPFSTGSVHTLGGLREASRYRISVAGASVVAFTYPYFPGRGGPLLHAPAGPADDPEAQGKAMHDDSHLQMLASGSRAVALWSCRRSRKSGALYFTQSFDSGLTWMEPERLHPFHPACSDPRLTLYPGGVQASWRVREGIALRTLSDRETRWTTEVVLPETAGGTAKLAPLSGSRAGGLFWRNSALDYRFQWLGLDSGRSSGLSFRPLFEGTGRVEAGRSLLTPKGAFVFLEIDSPDSDFIVWSSSADPDRGPWRPSQAMTGEDEDTWDWDVAEYQGRAYVAYDTRHRIRVRRSEELARFSEPVEPFGANSRQTTPALAPSADGLYLICGVQDSDRRRIALRHSMDGLSWRADGLPQLEVDHEPDSLMLARPEGRLVALEIEDGYGVGAYSWTR